MSETSEAEIREFLLEQVMERLQVAGVAPEDVDDSTDLLGSGIVDSLGVLELMTVVSDRFGVEDDWEDLDPEVLLVVGPFCRYAAMRAQGVRTDDTSS
jgi:acyl carrier protein